MINGFLHSNMFCAPRFKALLLREMEAVYGDDRVLPELCRLLIDGQSILGCFSFCVVKKTCAGEKYSLKGCLKFGMIDGMTCRKQEVTYGK